MAANSLVSTKQQKLQNKPLYTKTSSKFRLESFLQSHLPEAHGDICHCFSWLSHIKPMYLPGTRGKEKFSILLLNILITSSTLGSSPTNCVSCPENTRTAKLFQYKCLSHFCNHCTILFPKSSVCWNSDFMHTALLKITFSCSSLFC